jgi:hypothetical protein
VVVVGCVGMCACVCVCVCVVGCLLLCLFCLVGVGVMGKKKEKAVNVVCITLNNIENMQTLHKITKNKTRTHILSHITRKYRKYPKTY